MQRRNAGRTKERILVAAERRLEKSGPQGIRLTKIAADVGISHPAILHHFGTREGLVTALVERSLAEVDRELRATLEPNGSGPLDSSELLERMVHALGDAGHARLIAWLALSGRGDLPANGEQPLRQIAETVHELRSAAAEAAGVPAPPLEDSLFLVVLASTALLGDAVAGGNTRARAGLEESEELAGRYRGWLASLLQRLIDSQPEGAASATPERVDA